MIERNKKNTLKTRWPEARALRCFLSSIWNQRNCTRYTFLHLVDTVNYGHEIKLSSLVTIYSGWKPILGCHHLTTGETIMALLICSMLRGCWLLKPTCPPAITNAVTENWTLSRWYKQNSVMNLWSSKQEQNRKSRWLILNVFDTIQSVQDSAKFKGATSYHIDLFGARNGIICIINHNHRKRSGRSVA